MPSRLLSDLKVQGSLRRSAVANSSAKYVAILSSMVTRFFLTPFLIQTLGTELLGLQTLSSQVLGFVGLFSGALGVSYRRHATVSFAQNDFLTMNMYLSLGFWVSCLSAFIYLLCTAGVTRWAQQLFGLPHEIVHLAQWVIIITGIATAMHIVSGVFTSPSFILQKLYIPELATVISTISSALGVWFIFIQFRPSIIVWVLLATGCRLGAMVLVVIPWCKKLLPEMKVFTFPVASRQEFESLFRFGGFSLLGGLGYLLFYSTDSIMISNLNELGIAKVVFYNVAQRWDPMIRMGIGALVMSLTPELISRYASANYSGVHRILFKGTRYSLILGMLPCILLAVYAHPFLKFWLGIEFATESAPVMQLIMSTMIVSIPGIIGYEALVAAGRLGLAASATVLCGILNIIISLSLVKFWSMGLLGIALGSVSMLVLKNGFLTPWLVARYMKVPLSSYLKESYWRPFLIIVLFLPLTIFIKQSYALRSLSELFVMLAFCSIMYLPFIWFLGFYTQERTEIIQFLVGFIRKIKRWI